MQFYVTQHLTKLHQSSVHHLHMACFHEEPVDFTGYRVITCELDAFSVLGNRQKSSLSETERAQIVVLSQEGYSKRKISAKMRCNKTAVQTSLKNFNN